VFNLRSGEQQAQPVMCKKYGVRCVTWTHSATEVLHASSKVGWGWGWLGFGVVGLWVGCGCGCWVVLGWRLFWIGGVL